MTVQTKTKIYTPEEYLKLEETAECRSEYHDGEIIPMAGGSPNHNQIALNLSTALNIAFKQKPYRVFMADMRLWLPRYRRFVYPDVMVIQGELEFLEGRRDTLANPVLIAEVLSDSTEGYDRGDKFRMYRSLSSFGEYLLVDQSAMRLERFVRNDQGQWLFSDCEGADAVLKLETIPFEVKLAELYDKVDFGGEDGVEDLES
jgi:Uma2 family endonuclease